MTIAHIAIDNSDDKLTQREWSNYCIDLIEVFNTEETIHFSEVQIHGVWYSAAMSPFQNMCICVDVPDEVVLDIKEILSGICKEYRQDSIQWTVADQSRSGGIKPKD